MSITQKINTIEQFEEIKRTLENKNYLFRGEPQEFDEISSGLYRYARLPTTRQISPINVNIPITLIATISPDNLKEIKSEIQQTQKEIRENIVNYIQTKNLTERTSFSMEYIQHYGGITNFIDVTPNFEIATYFACSKDHDRDGRIILIKSTENYNCINLYKDPRFTENKRIQKQEGILIKTKEGYVKNNDCEMILIISRKIKKEILERLDANNINEKSIYPDEGDIETNRYIEQLKAELYNLPKHLEQADKLRMDGLNKQKTNKKLAIRLLKESIEEYNKAMKINLDYHTPHTLKAEVLLNLYELTGEKSHAKESLESCDMSIKLNPKGEEPLLHNPRFKKQLVTLNQKGIAYRIKGIIYYKIYNGQYLALKNLNIAIEINPAEGQAYYYRGLIYCMQYEGSTTKKIKMQKLDMAIKDFEKQIDVTPKQKENFIYTKCLELKNKASNLAKHYENE